MRHLTRFERWWYRAQPTTRLISIITLLTFGLWFVSGAIRLLGGSSQWFDTYLALGGSLAQWVHRPWTLFTYMWFHNSYTHWFFNMGLIYVFGRLFTSYYTPKQFYTIVLLGGLLGGFFYPLLFTILRAYDVYMLHMPLYGSSAALLTLVAATSFGIRGKRVTLLWWGKAPLYWVGLILIALVLLFSGFSNVGGTSVHLGGVLVGVLFAFAIRRGVDITLPLAWFIDRMVSIPKGIKLLSLRHRKRRTADEAILHKAKVTGYSSLTKQEKEQLQHHNEPPFTPR